MGVKSETVKFSDADIAAMAARLKQAQKPERLTMRHIIYSLYPDIKAFLAKGYTREELYDVMLTEEQKTKISKTAFIGCYQSVRKRKYLEGIEADVERDANLMNEVLVEREYYEGCGDDAGDGDSEDCDPEAV